METVPRNQDELQTWIVQEIQKLSRNRRRRGRPSSPLGERVTFTPEINGSGLSLGNGALTGSYVKIGKLALIQIQLTVGSTTTVTGDIQFVNPVGSAAAVHFTGQGRLNMGGTGYDVVTLVQNTILYARFRRVSGSNVVQDPASSSVPAAWTAGTLSATFAVVLN